MLCRTVLFCLIILIFFFTFNTFKYIYLYYAVVLLLSLQLKLSALLLAHGLSRRRSTLYNLLNCTGSLTEKKPPEDLTDSSPLANGISQSCWLVKEAPVTALPACHGLLFFSSTVIPHCLVTHHQRSLLAARFCGSEAGKNAGKLLAKGNTTKGLNTKLIHTGTPLIPCHPHGRLM